MTHGQNLVKGLLDEGAHTKSSQTASSDEAERPAEK